MPSIYINYAELHKEDCKLQEAIDALEDLKEKYDEIKNLATEIDRIRDDIKTVLEI